MCWVTGLPNLHSMQHYPQLTLFGVDTGCNDVFTYYMPPPSPSSAKRMRTCTHHLEQARICTHADVVWVAVWCAPPRAHVEWHRLVHRDHDRRLPQLHEMEQLLQKQLSHTSWRLCSSCSACSLCALAPVLCAAKCSSRSVAILLGQWSVQRQGGVGGAHLIASLR